MPIFPELRPWLEDAKLVAEPDAKYVITMPALRADKYANVGSQMARYIKRAGIKPWPKLFVNMRATRETELAAEFPIHVVCEWLGNSKAVAKKHYLRVTKADYAKATGYSAHPNAQLAASQQDVEKSNEWNELLRECVEKAIESGNFEQLMATVGKSAKSQQVPPTGFEPVLPD